MARLTAKYQLTLPKAVAQQAGLEPGDEVECEPAGEIVRVRAKGRGRAPSRSTTDQLVLFDLATERQKYRGRQRPIARATERDWTRDDLYRR